MFDIIVNPIAGSGKSLKVLDDIKVYLAKNDIEFFCHYSEKPKMTIDIVKSISQDGLNHDILVLGGDGTFYEALSGIKDFNSITLGLIPCGNGNDFAYSAGVSYDHIKNISEIIKKNVNAIDYIDLGFSRCLNICGTGLDVEVLKRYYKCKKKNKFTYVKCLLKVLLNFSHYDLKITIDDKTVLNGKYLLAACCNGKRFGAKLKISPYSIVDDGQMELILIKKINKLRIPFSLYNFLKGRHINKNYCETYSCQKVIIEDQNGLPLTINIDGELCNCDNLSAQIVPNTLKVFC